MALTGFDLTAYLLWIYYFSYYIRVKIYSCLGLWIFNNLIWHYYHPININLVCSVGRLFLINRIGSIINYSNNHYWTTRLLFLPHPKGQIKIITFLLLAVKEKFADSFFYHEWNLWKKGCIITRYLIGILIIIIAIFIKILNQYGISLISNEDK